MEIRTIRQVIDYVELMATKREDNGTRRIVEEARSGAKGAAGATMTGRRVVITALFGDHADRAPARGDRGEPPAGVSRWKPLKEDHLLTRTSTPGLRNGRLPVEYDFKRTHARRWGRWPITLSGSQRDPSTVGPLPGIYHLGPPGVAFGSTHAAPRSSAIFTEPSSPRADRILHDRGGRLSQIDGPYDGGQHHQDVGITGRVISSSTACTTSSQSIGYGYESSSTACRTRCSAAGPTSTIRRPSRYSTICWPAPPPTTTGPGAPHGPSTARATAGGGRGAGAVLLEEYEHARRRGADILGEVIGFACNNNGGPDPAEYEGDRRNPPPRPQGRGAGPRPGRFSSAPRDGDQDGGRHRSAGDPRRLRRPSLVTGFKDTWGTRWVPCGAMETIFTLYHDAVWVCRPDAQTWRNRTNGAP